MPEYLPDWEVLRVTAGRLVPHLRVIFGASAHDTIRSEQLGLNWDAVDANALRYARERAGELVGMKWDESAGAWVENPNPRWSITETTRARVNELTDEAVREGWSPQRLQDALEETGLFGEARAEMIARTEVAIAENSGQLRTMGEAGFDRVYVYDGDCDECAEVDGKVASLAWAEANPLQHPNCVRAFSGAPEDEPIELQ